MNDSQLSSRLRDLAGPEPTSEPPVTLLLRRGRRARRRRRVVTAATVMVAAAALAGVAVVVVDPRAPSSPSRSPAVAVETPKLDLVAAIAASQNISYKVKINVALRKTGSAMSEEDERLWGYVGTKGHDVNGAFDPTTTTGFRKSDFMEERLIDGVLYSSERGTAFSVTGRNHKTIPWGDDLSVSAGNADPAQVLNILRDKGVTTRTGTKTWHFRYEVPVQPTIPMGRVVEGDIIVGDDDRVRQIRYEPTYPAGARNPLGTPVRPSGVQHVIMIDLFDYGSPVVVEVPSTK
jgi:hypothetical protein